MDVPQGVCVVVRECCFGLMVDRSCLSLIRDESCGGTDFIGSGLATVNPSCFSYRPTYCRGTLPWPLPLSPTIHSCYKMSHFLPKWIAFSAMFLVTAGSDLQQIPSPPNQSCISNVSSCSTIQPSILSLSLSPSLYLYLYLYCLCIDLCSF
jgi:hypothetical protein